MVLWIMFLREINRKDFEISQKKVLTTNKVRCYNTEHKLKTKYKSPHSSTGQSNGLLIRVFAGSSPAGGAMSEWWNGRHASFRC